MPILLVSSSCITYGRKLTVGTDVIHIKSMLLELPHYAAVLERLIVYLRPGGMLVVVEGSVSYVSGQRYRSRSEVANISSTRCLGDQ
jgi:hypothetical protein